MSEDKPLERSVLESKERDELLAIAQAMVLKVPARSRKADIIDAILTAAGIGQSAPEPGANGAPSLSLLPGGGAEETPSPARPATRSRSRRSAAVSAPAEVAEAGEPATTSGETGSNGQGVLPALPGSGSERPGTEGLGTSEARANGSGGTDDGPSAEGGGSLGARPDAASGGGGIERSSAPVGQVRGEAPERATPSAETAGRAEPVPTTTEPSGPGGGPEGAGRRSRRRRGRDRFGERPEGQPSSDAHYQGELVPVEGLLDLKDEGYGFVRTRGFLPSPKDVYVSVSQVRRFGLRRGDVLVGASRPAANNEKYPALLRIDTVSGLSPDDARNRVRFEDLTPLFPDQRLRLEIPGDGANLTARIVDLLSPIGKGQRGLIVSPPKAGKTTILKQIAHSIETNNPEVHLMVLLVDERPEEVTDMRRSVKGEVVASTFDRPSEEHTQVAELAIERAKRLVELGRDVVIVLDGITRLARAYNLAQPATGRIMSGGVDSGALYPPKKFFGAARNIEEGGSLTILATALVETGSRMDEVIFEEFKGTGNMELRLDRRLAERRIYPAIDVNGSSTRHEELLFERSQLNQVWKLRRVLNALAAEGNTAAGLELLMDKIKTTKSNAEFLAEIAKGPTPAAV
jgi:transcription termination factor Rho